MREGNKNPAPGRRGFLGLLAGALAGAAGLLYIGGLGYPVYRYLMTSSRRAEAAAAVTEVSIPQAEGPAAGQAKMFKFGGRPAMLIRLTEDRYVAFSAVCTHLGCTVQFEADHQRIHCGCHGGVYDMQTGKNVSGPPPKPLTAYHVEVANGQVVISRA